MTPLELLRQLVAWADRASEDDGDDFLNADSKDGRDGPREFAALVELARQALAEPPGIPQQPGNPRSLPDLFSASVEAWLAALAGGPLEAHLLDLREATPRLYTEFSNQLFGG